MKKIGFVISVFDKIDEVMVLLDIISGFRFSNEVLVVCSDHTTYQTLKDDNVNAILVDDITFAKYPNINKNDVLNARIWESQRTGLIRLSESCEVLCHTHADGWWLSEEYFLKIVSNLNHYDALYRGMGLVHTNLSGEPLGKVDDHFYFIKSNVIRESKLIRRRYFDIFPGKINIHGMLGLLLNTEVGFRHAFRYETYLDYEYWDGKPCYRKPWFIPKLRPFVYGRNSKTIHCHNADFNDLNGQALQAHFLEKYNLKGRYIDKYIYDYKKDNIIDLINNEEMKLNQAIRNYRFDLDYFRRNLNEMGHIKSLSKIEKFKVTIKNMILFSVLANYLRKKKYIKSTDTEKSLGIEAHVLTVPKDEGDIKNAKG